MITVPLPIRVVHDNISDNCTISLTVNQFIPVTDFSNPLQMREYWQSYEVELVNYQNKTRLIKGWDDLFNKLKEHQNSLAAMKLSPYYKQFEEVGELILNAQNSE